MSSAKWNDATHIAFIELCEDEIRKGNRPGSHFSKAGWNNIMVAFNEKAEKSYTKKQLKNHWDQMKKEWTLFKNLMRGETGLGWDAERKTINADDSWWEDKIAVNKEYKKFRGRDLSLIWFRYDALFSDIAATGSRARAACQVNLDDTQRSRVGEEDEGEEDEEIDVDVEEEGDANESEPDPIQFPPPSISKRQTTEGSARASKRGKSTMATTLRENICDIVELMKNKSGGSSAVSVSDGTSIQQCLDTIHKMNLKGTKLGFHAISLFIRKEVQEIFTRLKDDEERLGWLQFGYNNKTIP